MATPKDPCTRCMNKETQLLALDRACDTYRTALDTWQERYDRYLEATPTTQLINELEKRLSEAEPRALLRQLRSHCRYTQQVNALYDELYPDLEADCHE